MSTPPSLAANIWSYITAAQTTTFPLCSYRLLTEVAYLFSKRTSHGLLLRRKLTKHIEISRRVKCVLCFNAVTVARY